MPGLVPGIHVLALLLEQGVDGRDKPGHDGWASILFQALSREVAPDQAKNGSSVRLKFYCLAIALSFSSRSSMAWRRS
jgi:hypothetical protein